MKKILLIDDEPEWIQMALQRGQYPVAVARDGHEALRAIADPNVQYELVILDLNLPFVNGIQVLDRIRADFRYGHIPVVILSAFHQDEIVVHGLRQGADLFLTKPVSTQKLLAFLNALIRRTQDVFHLPCAIPAQRTGKELTKRENGILELLVQGYTNQQIADSLVISEVTVRNHLANIFRKLGVRNRTQAAWYVQQMRVTG